MRISLDEMPVDLYQAWTALHQISPTYLVGGAVRDILRGHVPKDWDVATALHPEEVLDWGKTQGYRMIPTGVAFGTVTLRTTAGNTMEITTFRKDGRYKDGRHPQAVSFAQTLEEDLSRRDFTINALAATPDGEVMDLFDGVRDLRLRQVVAVGRPERRLMEDPLRMWRAVRLTGMDYDGAAFQLEPGVEQAIQRRKATLLAVSAERQRDELMKLLATPHFAYALSMADRTGVLGIVWPEWVATRQFEQHSPYHTKPVHAHLLATAAEGPTPFFRLVGLLHDIAKPSCFHVDTKGIGHFYGHDHLGAQYARTMLQRLAFDRDTMDRVCRLIDQHMFPWETAGDKAIRQFLREEGQDFVADLLVLRAMDVKGSGRGIWEQESAVRARVARIQGELASRRLAVSGHDVMAWLGISPGRVVGKILRHLQAWVDEDPARNTPEAIHHYLMDEWGEWNH